MSCFFVIKSLLEKFGGNVTAVARVQEKANQGLSQAMGADAFTRYQGMNLKPAHIETGFDPWIDHLQQKGK